MALTIAAISLPAMQFGIINISVCLSKIILICPSQRYYGSVKHNDPASIIIVVKRYIVLFGAYSPFYVRKRRYHAVLYLYRYAMYFKIIFDQIVVLILSISLR